MTENYRYLGIDYGGSSAKMGLVDAGGTLVEHASQPTGDLLDEASIRAFVANVKRFAYAKCFADVPIRGVGLAIPGAVANGTYSTPNVKADWPRVIEQLAASFDCSLDVVNDANAAALGELWIGAARHAQSVLLVTLGSGLGSGFAASGNVLAGAHGAAGELGHVIVEASGRLCSCGRRGCAERYASARGLVLSYREADAQSKDIGLYDSNPEGVAGPAGDTDALAVYRAAQAGDPRGIFAFSLMADKLGFALAQATSLLDPELILLGGGLTAGADLFLDDVRCAYRSYAFPTCAGTEIHLAGLLGNAGMIGAARAAMLFQAR